MSPSPNRLYDLLPTIYRQRDADEDYPLRQLLQVIAEQVDGVEADIGQLYDNWFIETCQDWMVPYIADLVGYRLVHEAGEPGDGQTVQGQQLNKILIPRREVANTIRYRRRKGTLSLLELLAQDVAGWPARAVEFYKLLGWTQHVNHLRPTQGQTADLRAMDALDLLNGPFEQLAHTVEVRRISSRPDPGRYNLPSVGLFVWRLRSYSVTKTLAYCLEDVADCCYTFSILGNDTPLFNRPQPELEPTHIAEELNLPTPIRRRAFELSASHTGAVWGQASPDYYSADADGRSRSLAIWAAGWGSHDPALPIPAEQMIPADLSSWQYQPPNGYVAVDPERGRIAFPLNQVPKENVWVSYRYGFSADMGGGEYGRDLLQIPDPLRLTADDVKDAAILVERLQEMSPLSVYLRSHLSPANQTAIANYEAGATVSNDWLQALLDDLNTLLESDRSLYSGDRFPYDQLPADLQTMVNHHQVHPYTATALLRCNRMLLEWAYGSAIALHYTYYAVSQDAPYSCITAALEQWEADAPRNAVIELLDSGVYDEQINGVYIQQIRIVLGPHQGLQLRAANGKRPVLRLLDLRAALPDALSVIVRSGSRFILDGLLVSGRGISIHGDMTAPTVPRWETGPSTNGTAAAGPPLDYRPPKITIRHCTLVPGWSLHNDCEPRVRSRKLSERRSLDLDNLAGQVVIERSILGSIQVSQDAVMTDPTRIHISDTILDATHRNLEALGAPGSPVAHARLTLLRSTIFGRVETHAIDLAENSILDGQVCVARRQEGCMRFCYAPAGSRTPRRYRCQPDLVEAAARERVERGELDATDLPQEIGYERLRVTPLFNGLYYGQPTYGQLAHTCAKEIQRGADDESEMGAFHHLYQPQRAANLQARLQEYMPAGMEAGIIYVT